MDKINATLDKIEEACWSHLETVEGRNVGDILPRLEILERCGVIRTQLNQRQVRYDTESMKSVR